MKKSINAFILVLINIAFAGQIVSAQAPFFLGNPGYEVMLPQYMQTVAGIMRQYYKSNGRMPQFESEMDKALLEIHNRLNINPADTTKMFAKSEGAYRVFGNVRMCLENSINNANAMNWRNIKPPENWSAPAYNIVVLSDGNDKFLIWVAGVDGRPLRDSSNRTLIVYEQCVNTDNAR
jgi:hypothetical protein